MVDADEQDELTWVRLAARAAEAKLADDILIIDVGDVLAITGHFVIASARNSRQVRAVCAEVEAQITAAGGPKPLRVEGLSGAEWVLADYGDFVVHIFDDETREYYQLERLWGDRPRVDWRN